uniref:Omega-hydroxypalmitate O-feruloyl transferase-like n=1 Tax=Populus alba TaxID=43335 RepID=A0A4V6ACD6_POPAL|nr:omega-hydroxypalmitate O-feruloyl transferase-like [Populus alba]
MEGTGKHGGDQLSIRKSELVLIEPETRTHSGFFFLSNLDKVITNFVHIVYLYKAKKGGGGLNTLSDIFKQSMAKILVHYYPLAGRLRLGSDGKYNVECTNEGVLFVEARANYTVTSWTRLPIECADFGWGEPAQFGCANLPKDSGFLLPDGKEKKGINLILDLLVTAMSTFQELMLL